MKNKILIWGIGKEFWRSYNILMLTVEKTNLEIVGYVSRDKIRDSVDGKKFFLQKKLAKMVSNMKILLLQQMSTIKRFVIMEVIF